MFRIRRRLPPPELMRKTTPPPPPYPCLEPDCKVRFYTLPAQDAHMADVHGLVWHD